MVTVKPAVPTRLSKPAAHASLGVAVLGAAAYALFAFNLVPPHGAMFGQNIYDQFYLAILNGHLDMPMRVLSFEGHYIQDGTGYLYQGVAPLLTRFALGWLLPLGQMSLAPFSVWLWAIIGTGCYHLALLDVARRSWPPDGRNPTSWAFDLGLAVWGTLPGLLLVANPTYYLEPIAVAYAASAVFVLIWTRANTTGQAFPLYLVGLALMAALTVHARPNIAIGLYLGTLIAVGIALWHDTKKALLPAIAAVGILGLGGLGYLALNALRFGSMLQSHGSFQPGDIQYGVTFWGFEPASSARAQAFVDHGRFNVLRIVPNLAMYLFDVPAAVPFLSGLAGAIEQAFRAVTEPFLGFIRIGEPRFGALYMWACWFGVITMIPLNRLSQLPKHMWGLLAGTGAAAIMTLAYGTIALRYRVDLWPVVATLVLLGLPVLVSILARQRGRSMLRTGLFAMLCLAILTNVTAAKLSRYLFIEQPGTMFKQWTLEECIALGENKGFSDARIVELCRPPYSD